VTEPVVLFDGTCNFCNGTVLFLVDRDDGNLRFAPLQSDYAAELLDRLVGKDESEKLRRGATGSGDPDSLVLVEGDEVFLCSTGALRIAGHLRAPWRWLSWFRIMPRLFRDAVYRFIARHRYGWFGKSETCRIPTPELRSRFLA
jgi:predicted DCC family thiol-disulfide oxidoreductase YuxK